jgi:hypothetical protein
MFDDDLGVLHNSRRSLPELLQSRRTNAGRSSFLSGGRADPGTRHDEIMGGIFGHAKTGAISMPTSEAEKVMLSAPACDEAAGDILAIGDESYNVSGVTRNVKGVIKKPVVRSEFFMSPAERRALLRYEVEKRKAEKIRRKALGDRGRMIRLMRIRHPSGALGMRAVPGVAPSPEVYASSVELEARRRSAQARVGERRKGLLSRYNNAERERGFPIIGFDPSAPVQKNIGAALGGTDRPRLTVKQSRDRLFNARKTLFDAARAERIRKRGLRGKRYNIVTGALPVNHDGSFDYNKHNRDW